MGRGKGQRQSNPNISNPLYQKPNLVRKDPTPERAKKLLAQCQEGVLSPPQLLTLYQAVISSGQHPAWGSNALGRPLEFEEWARFLSHDVLLNWTNPFLGSPE